MGYGWLYVGMIVMQMVFTHDTPSLLCPEDTPKCNEHNVCKFDWHFEDGPVRTITQEWGLVCGEAWKVGVAGFLFFGGFVLGAGSFGWVSDRYGRKWSFYASLITLIVSCALNAVLAWNFWMYAVGRMAVGLGVGGFGIVSYVLGTEFFGRKARAYCASLFCSAFAIGFLALIPFALVVPQWNWFLLSITSLGLLYFIPWVYRVIPESPIWLLVTGQASEARYILTRVASLNGTEMPSEPLYLPSEEGVADVSLTQVLFDVELAPWVFAMYFNWFATSFVYYGISLNTGNLGRSIYISAALSCIVELISYVVLACSLNRLGRRKCLAGCQFLCGTSLVICYFIESDDVRLAVALVGKFAICSAFAIVFVYAAELFPTVIRNTAMGVASQMGHIGAMISPMVLVLGQVDKTLPLVVWGVASLLAGFFAMVIPETQGRPLPNSVNDMRSMKNPPSTPVATRIEVPEYDGDGDGDESDTDSTQDERQQMEVIGDAEDMDGNDSENSDEEDTGFAASMRRRMSGAKLFLVEE
eukprot:TRINITY_DN2914_c4_g1_i2.p1 TRINITY_DN2914_c4_g1~~TRINITY_DN2914_c4_g1_i2.p1  ORF type:complete len:528 (-),score=57.09 TRINITY_DN2914_c4_g1_i2:18-1601(-)